LSHWLWKTDVLEVPVEVAVAVKAGLEKPVELNAGEVDYGPAIGKFTVRAVNESEAALDIELRAKKPGETFTLDRLQVKAHPRVRGIHRHHVATTPHRNRADWSSYIWEIGQTSTASVGVPFIQGYSWNGTNAFLMGYVDQVRDTRISHD